MHERAGAAAGRLARDGAGAAALGAASRRRRSRRRWRTPPLAGADRAPDRGAAQEHPRRRARDRPPAGRARERAPARGRAARARGQRGADPRPRHAAVADALLRFTKLTVADEIENALSYYAPPSCARSPSCTRELERALGTAAAVASFLRMGQWIGGDRDGNPYVTADTLRIRAARGRRGGAAPLPDRGARAGRRAVDVRRCWSRSRPRCRRWPTRSPDRGPPQDEPYRRALTGMYARLAATLQGAHRRRGARHAVAPQNPYRDAEDFLADLRTIARSLLAHHAEALVAARLQPLIRAVEVFGFHLATVDLRQSSDQHEEVVAELLHGGADRARLPASSTRRRARAAAALLDDARPLRVLGAGATASTREASWRSSRPPARCARASARRRSATTSSATPRR